MRIRRIAILIDGGYFYKRLPSLVEEAHCKTPEAIATSAYLLAKRHVQNLIREPYKIKPSHWLDHVYRIFYYDAHPYSNTEMNPITGKQVFFEKTPQAKRFRELHNALRKRRKFALRLGHLSKEEGWKIRSATKTKKILRTKQWIHVFQDAIENSTSGKSPQALTPEQVTDLKKIIQTWNDIAPDDVSLGLRQKGVDMRIGLDIATITLKKQADTIILVTGDSDFVPAAKVARREGVEFLLDPLWQNVKDDLNEHVDGIVSVFRNPKSNDPPEEILDTEE